MYTINQLRRLYLVKLAVTFTIVTFLFNQAIEAMVVAEFIPVWTLRFSLIGTVLLFPFVMYIGYTIIYKNDEHQEQSFEDRFLNTWLLVCSILVLAYAIFERFYNH